MARTPLVIALISLLVALLAAPAFADDARALHDRVQAAYEKYTAAVAGNAGEAEVKAALDAYQALYRDYLARIGAAPDTAVGSPVGEAGPAARVAAASADSPLLTAAVPAEGQPAQSRFVEPRRLAPALYEKKSKVNEILGRLEAALAGGVDSPIVESRLRLELAFLYSEFKKDTAKARETLARVLEFVKQGLVDEKTAAEATETESRLAAKESLAGYAQSAIGAKQAAFEARARVSGISFFRQPLAKIGAWWDYLKIRTGYRSSVAKLREYRAEYERSGNAFFKPSGLSFLFDMQRFDLDVTDIYDAITVPEEVEDARLRLIVENVESWHARWHILEQARRSIDVTYFIIEPDIFGKSLLGILLKKAKEGVRIRFMIDARGTKQLAKSFMGQDYLQELVQYPNVQVKVFNPLHGAIPRVFSDIRALICSNHDKIILVDGEWVITGGRNVSKNYFPDPADYETVFRDTDILIHSPRLGEQMAVAFTEEFDGLYNKPVTKDLFGNWVSRDPELTQAYLSMNRFLRDGELYPPEHGFTKTINEELGTYRRLATYRSYRPFRDDARHAVKVIDKHSFNDERNDMTESIIRLMEAANEEIVIQNPYVILTDVVQEAMKRADRRGVKLLIHTNSPVSTDSLLTQAFFIDDWKKFLVEMPNLRIFAFDGKNKLHAKVFVFDRLVSVVGTYNMDYMSEQINSEVAAVIKSAGFSGELRQAIDRDLQDSVEYKARAGADGKPEAVYGPRDFSPKKTLLILDMLKQIKILKYLI